MFSNGSNNYNNTNQLKTNITNDINFVSKNFINGLGLDSNFTIDSSEIIRNAIQIIGLHNYSPEYLGKSLKLVSKTKSKIPYNKIVGPIFDLSKSDVENAFNSLDKKKSIRPGITIK